MVIDHEVSFTVGCQEFSLHPFCNTKKSGLRAEWKLTDQIPVAKLLNEESKTKEPSIRIARECEPKNRDNTPEENLLVAILDRAIRDCAVYDKKKRAWVGRAKSQWGRTAYNWVMCDEVCEWSFIWVCISLEFTDSTVLRIRKLVSLYGSGKTPAW